MEEGNILVKIDYISCEGNERWFTVIVPENTPDYQIEERLLRSSGMGDDPAEFVSAEEYPFYNYDEEYYNAEDWTDINEY